MSLMQQRSHIHIDPHKGRSLLHRALALCLVLLGLLGVGWLRLPTANATSPQWMASAAIASVAAQQISPPMANPVAPPFAPRATNTDDEVVYLDLQGYIRTFDPTAPASGPAVQWVSPTGGWRDFALGDFNQDGDLEIVAVGGDANSGRLAIYDPVLTDGAIDADQIINEVPWELLYEAPLIGRPLQVATGELDPASPGLEIALLFALNPEDRLDQDDKTRLSIWQALLPDGASAPDGRQWRSAVATVDFGNTWEHLALGELDNIAGEEMVLVDDGIGLVRVYRLEAVADEEEESAPAVLTLSKIYENESGARPWLDGVVARFVPTEQKQLALARSSSPGGNTFWVLYYDPGADSGFSDAYAEFLLPSPRAIFAGDIDNDGDDEIFLLRDVPTNDSRFRLVMRNYDNVNHPLPAFELPLDTDNGYKAGATGDTDGDGRAEVIIMRNNGIRIYTAPESNSAALIDTALTVTTDQQTIAAGNLDRNGVRLLPKLSVTTLLFNQVTLYAGQQRNMTLQVDTLTTGAPGPIPFTIAAVDQPAWLVLMAQDGITNSTIDVQLDASTLREGLYQATILITSPDKTVANTPFSLTVNLQVLPGLVPKTTSLVVPYNCSQSAATIARTLPLNGPEGLLFSATVNSAAVNSASMNAESQPRAATASAASSVLWPSEKAWVTASSPNLLPTTMKLTFDPAGLAAGVERDTATLSFFFYDGQGRQERTVALTLYCASDQLYLPLIRQ